MPILDANVILRYLLRDITDMAEEARSVVMAGASTTTEVLAEVVYVLAGVYGADRAIIADALALFLQEVDVPHKPAVQYAFRLYRESRLDFLDCVLAGYHHMENLDVVTFDKKLKRALASDRLAQD